MTIYTFLTQQIQIFANFSKPFKVVCAKICSKFLCRNCAICFLLFKA